MLQKKGLRQQEHLLSKKFRNYKYLFQKIVQIKIIVNIVKFSVCIFVFVLLTPYTAYSGTEQKNDIEEAGKVTIQSYVDKGAPSEGNFVVRYFINDSGKMMYRAVYESNLDTVEVDMTNLSVSPDELGSFFYFLELDNNDDIESAVRLELLETGAASIDDISKASKEEIEAEKSAKEQVLGVWKSSQEDHQEKDDGEKTGDDAKEDHADKKIEEIKKMIDRIKDFVSKVFNSVIIRWILATVFSFGFLLPIFIKLIQRRNVMLFFGGDKSAGKTTLRQTIMNESIPEGELLDQAPTNATNRSRFIRDEKNRRVTIYSNTIDIPGDNNYEVINFLGRKRYRFLRKAVLIIVVSATKRNDGMPPLYDADYIMEQKYSAQKLWTAVIRSKVTRIRSVILFINKNDLYEEKKNLDSTFSEHIEIIEEACRSVGTRFTCIIGSSVKRIGIAQIYEELCKR